MKVAYVTMYDANDLKNWSGHRSPHSESAGASGGRSHVHRFAGGQGWRTPRPSSGTHESCREKALFRERDPKVARGYAAQVEERLAGLDVDWIISPGTIPIAELAVSTPIAFWTDATFGQMIGLYPEFEHLSAATVRAGNTLEQRALERAVLAITPLTGQRSPLCAITARIRQR